MRLAVCAAVLATACGVSDEMDLSLESGNTDPCFGCGRNGGKVDEVDFYGLWRSGKPNERGVRLIGYSDSYAHALAGVFLPRWDISQGRLRWEQGAIWREHDGVTGVNGSTFTIEIARKDGGVTRYYLMITEVHSNAVFPGGIPYWTTGPVGSVESYHIQWVAAAKGGVPTNQFVDVCGQPIVDKLTTKYEADMMVYGDDKYDPDTLKVSLEGLGWINFACQGTVEAKTRLTRRATASSDFWHSSTVADDRQAVVLAYGASYCGLGPSFTHTGHRIRIIDKKGWLPTAAPFGFVPDDIKSGDVSIEALWDANGAICLETPRMRYDDPSVPPDTNIEKDIESGCAAVMRSRPPKCSELLWYKSPENFLDTWKDHGQFLTGVAKYPVP